MINQARFVGNNSILLVDKIEIKKSCKGKREVAALFFLSWEIQTKTNQAFQKLERRI